MGDGDGGVGIFCHEEKCHGFADDHAASEDYGFGTIGIDAGGGEESHRACGGAGDKACGIFECQFRDVLWMEAIDVFAGIDGADDFFFVDVLGRWALDEDAVDGGIVVEIAHDLHEFLLAGGGGEDNFLGENAEIAAGFDFGTDVDLGGWIFANEDNSEARLNALGGESENFLAAFGKNSGGYGFSVDEIHGVLYSDWYL